MSPHYESTAHLLLMLTQCGLTIPRHVDCRNVLGQLDHRFARHARDAKGLTHSGAALFILDDLVRAKLVTCDDKARPRVLAIIGSGIANVEHQIAKPATKHRGARRS